MPESEKITINLSAVDLGKIDLLVQEGLYANRSDLIRTAIRNQLDKHSLEIQQSVTRNAYTIGVLAYDKSDFERFKAKGKKIRMTVIGMLHLGKDITPELGLEVIESIQVRGIFHASDELKAALADRME